MIKDHRLYFGRTMPFKDNSGTLYESSFWKLEHFSIDTANRILYIQFVAYKSTDDFDSGGESLIKQGGSWTRTYTGETYDKMILKYAMAVGAVAQATWQIADLTKEKPGADAFESFFAEAGEVITLPEMQSLFKQ